MHGENGTNGHIPPPYGDPSTHLVVPAANVTIPLSSRIIRYRQEESRGDVDTTEDLPTPELFISEFRTHIADTLSRLGYDHRTFADDIRSGASRAWKVIGREAREAFLSGVVPPNITNIMSGAFIQLRSMGLVEAEQQP